MTYEEALALLDSADVEDQDALEDTIATVRAFARGGLLDAEWTDHRPWERLLKACQAKAGEGLRSLTCPPSPPVEEKP